LIRLWTIRKLGDNSKLFGHPKEVYVCLYLIMMRVIKCSMHALIAFQTLLLYLLTVPAQKVWAGDLSQKCLRFYFYRLGLSKLKGLIQLMKLI
jgi:hypothetical protein